MVSSVVFIGHDAPFSGQSSHDLGVALTVLFTWVVAPPSRRLSVDASQDTARPPTLSQRSTGSRGSSAW